MRLAQHGKTRGVMGTGMGLARQVGPGRVFEQVWNRTEPFYRSKPGPLVGFPDQLLTLPGTVTHPVAESQTNSERCLGLTDIHSKD
jgi:hypothetical protein